MSPLNPFKQCNIEIRVFVLAIFATNKEKKTRGQYFFLELRDQANLHN